MRYGSVCSGIEAASVAWEPLGWQPAWFAEIEPFPSAVLAHHWPHVTNLGDMTTIAKRVLTGQVAAPDVLVGGTPCQAFSVAGMREGLRDERGQLTIKFVELADAIDLVRDRAGKPESVIVWENVPGVLSDKENAFGCFLGALAGEDCELQPSGERWTNAGCVYGPQRAVAWRVLDAQYFGVAQRRRRVFVVASARAGLDPAAVLFESEGVRRDSPPSREAGKEATGDAERGTPGAVPILEPGARTGKSTTDVRVGIGIGQDGDPMFTLQAGKQHGVAQTVALRGREGGATAELGGEVATALRASTGGGDKPHVLTVHGTQDPCVSGSTAFALGRNNGGENAVYAFAQNSRDEVRLMGGDGGIVGALAATPGMKQTCYVATCEKGENYASGQETDSTKALRTLRETVGEKAFTQWGLGVLDSLQPPEILRQAVHGCCVRCQACEEKSRLDDSASSRPQAGAAWAVCAMREAGRERCTPQGRKLAEQCSGELGTHLSELSRSGASPKGFLLGMWQASEGLGLLRQALSEIQKMGRSDADEAQPAQPRSAVRRLMPVETERLQGFPDGHTNVPYRNKPAADGPRYKAIGNSMAVPCMSWLGRRIEEVAALCYLEDV